MNTHRLTQSAALALAVAAIAAPTAAADQDIRNPDNRTPLEQQGQDLRMPDTRDYAEGRGTYNSPQVMVIKVPEPGPAAAPASGIDWSDAGIGAGTILGLSLIGAGGTLLLVHRKQSAPFRVGTGG